MSLELLESRILKIEDRIRVYRKETTRLKFHRMFLVLLAGIFLGLGFKADTETENLKAKEIRAETIRADEIIITKGTDFAKAVITARSDGKQGLEIRNSSQRVLLKLPND